MTLTRRPTVLLIAALFLVIGAAFLTQLIPYRQIIDSNRQVESARAELTALEAENTQLQADVAALETPEEIERLAREKLGYARPGETAYVVLDPPGAGQSVTRQDPEPAAPERTWVEKIWDFVSGGDIGS
ncbi:MAG: septum formation initiator family protein [Acidimicrobiia bacterium]